MKVINFNPKTTKTVDFVADALETVKAENVDNMMLCCKIKHPNDDDYVLTGYCNLTLVEKLELLSHLYLDCITQIINTQN